MTQKQLLTACSSMLKLMSKNGIRVKDVETLDMVNEADIMEAQGEQKGYIVQKLADKYGISVRSVYSAIDRLHSEITL